MRRADPRATARRLPAAPGVYRFRAADGRVLYLGRAADLRRRVGSYWGDLRGRRHLARMVIAIRRVEAVVCGSEHEAAWLERDLLESRMPRWNRTPGGQETPVHILLDDSGPVARVAVAHAPVADPAVRSFGPYLGGARTRSAVAALRRVFPLDYAGEALTGTDRALAAARAVHVGSRSELVDAVRAVLERDPIAVAWLRDELARRRDAASADLAFERAAHLQAERDALDWVLAPQEVHRPGTGDHDVLGWAGGVAVAFEIRDGRARGWTQERRPAPPAPAPPGPWQAFADRAAGLAAELSGPAG